LEFSTVEGLEQGSSATDSLSEDVTDGWMEEGRRKKEKGKRKNHSSNSQRLITNAQCFAAQLPITNYQLIPKTNRARTARPIY
jgi:hypothetical protein